MTPENTRVYRIALAFWLFGWFCNAEGFTRNFLDALRFPISYDLFPAVIRLPGIAFAAYLLPMAGAAALVWPTRAVARSISPALAIIALFECFHLETCNDATFVTSFWSALWLTWLAFSGHRDDDAFRLQARALAQGVVGLMFLGGAVGKLTPEHRSGEAFYGLYFRDNDSFPYPWLKAHFSADTVRGMASWFSRFALSGEIVLSAAPLLPTRFVLAGAAVSMSTMMLAWTFHLASVLSCLFGLLVASYLLDRDP